MTVGPAKMGLSMVVRGRGGRRGFFDDPFFGGEPRRLEITSDPLELTVLPLPEADKPADFSGAVGSFDFEVKAAPLDVAAGDPVTVTYTIRGTGSLDNVTPPAIPAGDGLRVYPPQQTSAGAKPAAANVAERTFEQVVIPERAGTLDLPTLRFSFFDPATNTTERLAGQAGCDVVMMLANPTVRVALATTHLPLRAVADAIAPASLERTLRILHRALREDFGIAAPRIAVLGLNPHAGEEGHLGREEIDVIQPVLEALRADGMHLDGPLPADTAFLPAKLRGFDAVLAMYHDQGLPVLKFSGFEQAVNLTLGLPYPRVAVDHGTALDLAGRGVADPSSLFAAVETCARLARAKATA